MKSGLSRTHYHPGVALDDLQLVLAQTPANVWQTLAGQKIFITGGTGFVGCWLLECLIWADIQLDLKLQLHILTRNPDNFVAKAPHLALYPSVNLISGDVTDLQHIHGRFDTIIHAATDVIKPDSNPLAAYAAIVKGTEETLELARRSHAGRYLLTSSGAVYGRQPASLTHVPEDYAGAPCTGDTHSAYGQGKRISEWLCHNYAKQYGFEVQVARCFALIGPYLPLDAHFAAGNFIGDGLAGRDIAINGDGTALRSYLYAADMTVWLLSILINGERGQSYNLGSSTGIAIKDLAEQISHIIYKENRVTLAKPPIAHGEIQRYVPAVDKAKTKLGLQEYTDLHHALTKTITWEVRRRESARQELDH